MDAMTIYANSSGTLSTTSTKMTLGGSVSTLSSGSNLARGSNCITVNNAGKVLVSANSEITGCYRADKLYLRLFAGSSVVGYCGQYAGYYGSNSSIQMTMSICPRVISVPAGTEISMYGQSSASRGTYGSSEGNQTYLTVVWLG